MNQEKNCLIYIVGWFRNLKEKCLILRRLFKFKCSLELIKCHLKDMLFFTSIYPITWFVFKKEKAQSIRSGFLKSSSPLVVSLPSPLKSKIVIPSEFLIYDGVHLYDGIYLKNEYHQELLEKGMNVIDIGAHIGAYTILAAEKIGEDGKVLSIEPEPKNYKQLLENIKLNNFQNVIPKNIALSDHEGVEKLYLNFYTTSHSLVIKNDNTFSIEVRVKTLDKLLEEIGLDKIDFIKIDAEGVELEILKGAEKTLKRNPKVKMAIAAYHYTKEKEEVLQYLTKLNFFPRISKEIIFA